MDFGNEVPRRHRIGSYQGRMPVVGNFNIGRKRSSRQNSVITQLAYTHIVRTPGYGIVIIIVIGCFSKGAGVVFLAAVIFVLDGVIVDLTGGIITNYILTHLLWYGLSDEIAIILHPFKHFGARLWWISQAIKLYLLLLRSFVLNAFLITFLTTG